MAREQGDPAESGKVDFSSSPSKKIEDTEGLPGGRSRAAARRVGSRGGSRSSRKYTRAEQEALLREQERSGESVKRFAARRGLPVWVLYQWRHRARANGRAGPLSRGLSAEDRRSAVEALARSGMAAKSFSKLWGVSARSLRSWQRAWKSGGPKALEPKKRGRPKGDGRSRLPAVLQAEIVRTKTRFPVFGLKKVRDFLKRFQGEQVSTGSVRKVLKSHGLHMPMKPRKQRHALVARFERSRPGELWQSDITSFVLTRSSVRVYLTVFLDDFSRYVVAWQLATQQKSQLVCEALMEGIDRFGKPQEALTDQGRQYFAWRGKSAFQRLLVREGIRHVVARTHHPETLGKCERLWETIRVELWERTQPQELAEARERLAHYFAFYNHFRPHQGIGGLVPADRFFGAENALRATLESRMERDELGAALSRTPRQSLYVFGQVGDQQVSLHGERGRIVLMTSDGITKELALEDLGLAQQEKKQEPTHERSNADHDDRSAPAPAAGQEAPGVSAAAAHGELGAEPMGVGERGGEGEIAHDVRGDPVDVAGQEEPCAGGLGAGASAAAGLAAQPDGALGYARGPLEAAPGPGQGAPDGDVERGRSACAEEAHRRAGGGQPLAEGALGGAEGPAVGESTARATPPDKTGGGEAWQEGGTA